MTNQLIGTRIKVLRQEQGLSQDELAHLFGFKDRQTVSAMETGIRRITASELLLAVESTWNTPVTSVVTGLSSSPTTSRRRC